jgi:hypothetical protein
MICPLFRCLALLKLKLYYNKCKKISAPGKNSNYEVSKSGHAGLLKNNKIPEGIKKISTEGLK